MLAAECRHFSFQARLPKSAATELTRRAVDGTRPFSTSRRRRCRHARRAFHAADMRRSPPRIFMTRALASGRPGIDGMPPRRGAATAPQASSGTAATSLSALCPRRMPMPSQVGLLELRSAAASRQAAIACPSARRVITADGLMGSPAGRRYRRRHGKLMGDAPQEAAVTSIAHRPPAARSPHFGGVPGADFTRVGPGPEAFSQMSRAWRGLAAAAPAACA